jgi:hypothetical protein
MMKHVGVGALANSDLYQATWTSTVTSRLLLEAGVSVQPLSVNWGGQEYAANDLPGILDVATLSFERNAGGWWGARSE